MSNIAIIPARGSSKRLPRKNVMDFFGKPMIAWTIQAAIGSAVFDRVIVSTEDAEIARIGRAAGAEVPFLRQTHHDDHASASSATIVSLGQAERHFSEDYDVVVQLMANCPLREAEDIRRAVAAFEARGAAYQISCVRFGWMNPWWAMKRSGEGRPEPLFRQALVTRSQDLPALYAPTGAIWVARRSNLLAAGTFYGPDYRVEPMPCVSGIDIDDEEDLAFARAAYLMRHASMGDALSTTERDDR